MCLAPSCRLYSSVDRFTFSVTRARRDNIHRSTRGKLDCLSSESEGNRSDSSTYLKMSLAAFQIFVAKARYESSNSSETAIDRKSTRLNSSHGYISYAVF